MENINASGVGAQEVAYAKKVLSRTQNFLTSTKIVNSRADQFRDPTTNTAYVIGSEALNGNVSLDSTKTAIESYLRECEITDPRQLKAATESVKNVIKKFANNTHAGIIANHFASSAELKNSATMQNNMNTFYAPSAMSYVSNMGQPGMEAFGANTDTVMPDLRSCIAITPMQYKDSLVDKLLPRHATEVPYVNYKVPYSEVYDIMKSNDPSADVRNEGSHRVPFIDLYADPRAVSAELKLIVPLKANDTDPEHPTVYQDGYILPQTRANLFDLARIADKMGYTHTNYTDLISENVFVNDIIISVNNGTTTERYRIPVKYINSNRLLPIANTNDSGIRQAMFDHVVAFDASSTTMEGTPTTIFTACTASDKITVNFFVSARINLKYASVYTQVDASIDTHNVSEAPVIGAVADLAKTLTVKVEGVSFDARYSEENLRKSSLAINMHWRTFDFEINAGRNAFADSSLQEALSLDEMLPVVNRAINLGQDYRTIELLRAQMDYVHRALIEENEAPSLHARLDRLGFNFIASQQVRPVVYSHTIDMDGVDGIRSGDFYGDARSYAELDLQYLTSLLWQNSFYKQQLPGNEAAILRVLTSDVILDSILAIPHYHNHLNANDQRVENHNCCNEYTRVLPNGTVLQVVTTTFDYLRDKFIMFPVRPDAPDSILNAAHYWDNGTIVCHYNPQADNAVHKRVFANSRAQAIPTNIIGILGEVRNISKTINMVQTLNRNGVDLTI